MLPECNSLQYLHNTTYFISYIPLWHSQAAFLQRNCHSVTYLTTCHAGHDMYCGYKYHACNIKSNLSGHGFVGLTGAAVWICAFADIYTFFFFFPFLFF